MLSSRWWWARLSESSSDRLVAWRWPLRTDESPVSPDDDSAAQLNAVVPVASGTDNRADAVPQLGGGVLDADELASTKRTERVGPGVVIALGGDVDGRMTIASLRGRPPARLECRPMSRNEVSQLVPKDNLGRRKASCVRCVAQLQ